MQGRTTPYIFYKNNGIATVYIIMEVCMTQCSFMIMSYMYIINSSFYFYNSIILSCLYILRFKMCMITSEIKIPMHSIILSLVTNLRFILCNNANINEINVYVLHFIRHYIWNFMNYIRHIHGIICIIGTMH